MYTTKITQLECRQDDPDFPDCVQTVHYLFTKTVGEHTASIYGTKSMAEPGTPYTSFPSLTEQQVIDWCEFDLIAIESALDAQLQQMQNPVIIGKPVPWGQS